MEAWYFTGPHCGVCHSLLPRMEHLFREKFPQIPFREIDISEEVELAAQNLVFTLPVLSIRMNDQEIHRFARVFSVLEVEAVLDKLTALYS